MYTSRATAGPPEAPTVLIFWLFSAICAVYTQFWCIYYVRLVCFFNVGHMFCLYDET